MPLSLHVVFATKNLKPDSTVTASLWSAGVVIQLLGENVIDGRWQNY
jgi:hypothetical protein